MGKEKRGLDLAYALGAALLRTPGNRKSQLQHEVMVSSHTSTSTSAATRFTLSANGAQLHLALCAHVEQHQIHANDTHKKPCTSAGFLKELSL